MKRFASTLTLSAVAILFAMTPHSAPAQPPSDADKLYKANCVICHAADGSGSSPTGKALAAKNLASSDVQKQSDAELNDAITKGKGKMPAFGKKLKPDEISQLVAYVRGIAKKP